MNKTLVELLNNRSPSRAISSAWLGDDVIEKLMQAAQLSASCFNSQSWRFLFLNDKPSLEKGWQALTPGNSWAKKAPLLVIGFSKPDLDCRQKDGRQYYLFDLGMATQLIMLQATELGLIARPMAGFRPDILKDEFNIPEEYEIYIMLAVGKPGKIDELDEKLRHKSSESRSRNPLDQNFFIKRISNL